MTCSRRTSAGASAARGEGGVPVQDAAVDNPLLSGRSSARSPLERATAGVALSPHSRSDYLRGADMLSLLRQNVGVHDRNVAPRGCEDVGATAARCCSPCTNLRSRVRVAFALHARDGQTFNLVSAEQR